MKKSMNAFLTDAQLAPEGTSSFGVVEARLGATHKNFPVVLVKLYPKKKFLTRFASLLKPSNAKIKPESFIVLALHPKTNELLGARRVDLSVQ